MRKHYKPTYGFTFFLAYSYLFFLFFVVMLPTFVFLTDEYWVGIILYFLMFVAFFFILFLVINLISKLFTKPKVTIDDQTIYYKTDIVRFSDISRISFDCGELSKYSSKPHSVTIICGHKNYVHIERAPLMLIYILKSKCGEVFKINNLKRLIFLWPSLAFVFGFIVYFFFAYCG